MKELMARDNGNQDVGGHECRTSTFIIKISDRINFVIHNGRGPYLCVLLLREKFMVTLYDYECIILIYP
jgi:hypothetical protein